jgi:adenosine deaminase
MRDLARLPKAELHVHLEGSIRTDTIRELADRQGRDVPSALGPGGWSFDHFDHFIEQYGGACDLLNDLDDFHRVAREFCADLAANGVRYAEVVFSPAQHAGRLGDWIGPIEAVLDGLATGERAHGVVCRLSPDVIRDLGMDAAEGTLEVAIAFAGRGVISLNCAGSERNPARPYADLFRRAREAGLRSVPHAGEWNGPDSVRDALDHLQPDRIGHGVRSIEDPALVDRLVDLAIPLEVCLTSNVRTGVVHDLAHHPFPRLRDAGVVVTLNSDDPAMFGSWLADEYRAARESFGLNDAALAEVARTGVRSSFADEPVRRELLAGIDAWIGAPDA